MEEDKIPTPKQEDNMPMHVIPYEGESVSLNENLEKSSEFTYQNKDANTDMSSYDRVLNTIKKIDKSYNPTMPRIIEPVTDGNYKVMRDTIVVLIVEHEDEKIQWECSTSISTDARAPETLKEAMINPNGHLWKMSAIS